MPSAESETVANPWITGIPTAPVVETVLFALILAALRLTGARAVVRVPLACGYALACLAQATLAFEADAQRYGAGPRYACLVLAALALVVRTIVRRRKRSP